MLTKYRVLFWDFDGVIMDSMAIRDMGFELVLDNYPEEQIAKLMEYHRRNGGLSRYHKFRYFFEQIRQQSITEIEIQKLANEFSNIMLQRLLDPALLVSDAIRFIRENYQVYQMHIVSGSDQVELRHICEVLGLSRFFKSIHGSPTPKTQLIQELLGSNGYNSNLCCVIGDSLNDLEAAHQNGVDFLGYNNLTLMSEEHGYIHRFSDLRK